MNGPETRGNTDLERAGASPRARGAAIAASIAGVAALATYIATLSPTVLADDSAELVSAAHVLGICHPTGYPLYLLLAKVFDLLPFATPPVRVGLFSACCAAGAAAAMAWATARVTASAPAGLLAGLVAAFNGPMWSNATQPEVYALNALIVSLAIAVFVRGDGIPRRGDILWLAGLAGLGLAHHRTAIFFTAPLLVAATIVQRPVAKAAAKIALAGLAPLLLYLYLPIRSAAHPPVMRSDLTNWEEVIPYLTARDYYEIHAFARPLPEAAALASIIFRDLASELTYGGMALAVVGLVALWRRHRALSVALLVGAALLSAWNLVYYVDDIMEFFVPCALAIGLWAGAGMAAVVRGLHRLVGRRAAWAASAAAVAMLIFVPASLLQRNWEIGDHRGEWISYDVTRAIFAQIEPDGILMTNLAGDNFISMYLQVVEGIRPDITVVNPYGSFIGRISDPRIEQALWALTARYGEPGPSLTGDAWSELTLNWAVAVGDAVAWTRPVYCRAKFSHAPTETRAWPLWSDFFRITGKRPQLTTPAPDQAVAAQFADGISLARASVNPGSVRPRDLLRITLGWRSSQRIQEPPLVLLRLLPEAAPSPAGKKMLGDYGAWFAYGVAPLLPTPEGSVYRQEVAAVAPTNAPSGLWAVWIGVTPPGEGRVELKRVGEFRVLP